ncbi:DUF3426 domain-containing protein [Gilvimarinus sp. F26214L]|uniref:DUF3426 domain-containing protein n=1 Tax=Gilvimarinus sp. DZF01 TaxID=3461371 RepID=UPI0040462522
MANMITRCPACDTSFRITEAQLNTARGAVRCGSCLHIFKASENLVPARDGKPQADTTRPASPAKPGSPDGSPAEPRRRETGPGTRDNSAARRPAQAPSSQDEPLNSAFEGSLDSDWHYGMGLDEVGTDAGQNNMLRFDQASIDGDEGTGEDFSDDLLISDEMVVAGSERSGAFGDDLSESFLELDGWKPAERSLFDRSTKPKPQDDDEDQNAPDESWALSLLEEDEDDSAGAAPASPKPRDDQPSIAEPFAELQLGPSEHEEPAQQKRAKNPRPGNRTAPHSQTSKSAQAPLGVTEGDRIEPSWNLRDELDLDEEFSPASLEHDDFRQERSALLSRIEPEPVEFSVHQGRNWRGTLLWGSMALLGLVALIVQIGWLQFERLSREQPYRDLYARICPLIGCELPSLAAPELIRTSNLVVRSHPQAEGALMVDTILLNTAPYQQPFPDLVLTFSDIHGQTLAERRFTPREYLAGELAGQNQMPSNQPVHLSLEIVDPGSEAVNYSAYIPD